MSDDIKVSVVCITYNHGKYIRDALESFITQITDFKFEVLVHDDASKDNTVEVINEYALKYPNIIKPILQKENQYSKKIDILSAFIYPKAKGKYIALCEGDDYWIDPYKLQAQFDYMENHEECTLCFHNAIIVDSKKRVIRESFLPSNELYHPYFKDYDCDYSTDEMILLEFVPTNSLFFRLKDIIAVDGYLKDKKYVCGDLPIRLYMTERGYAHYIHKKYSAYRKGVEGSASQQSFATSPLAAISTLVGHFQIYDDFSKYTQGKYDDSILKAKEIITFLHYMGIGAKSAVKKKEFKYLYDRLSAFHKCAIILRSDFPRIFTLLNRVRSKCRHGYNN